MSDKYSSLEIIVSISFTFGYIHYLVKLTGTAMVARRLWSPDDNLGRTCDPNPMDIGPCLWLYLCRRAAVPSR